MGQIIMKIIHQLLGFVMILIMIAVFVYSGIVCIPVAPLIMLLILVFWIDEYFKP